MQQMSYLGYQAPQQTAAVVPMAPMLFANSILPMIPGSAYNHWHVTREDFQVITNNKAVADYIRDIENQTTYVVNKLRDDGRLPLGYLPDPSDLWVIASPRTAEKRTLNAWGHAMYQDCVEIMEREEWVTCRWVAPLEHPTTLATTIYYGLFDNKPYIVVEGKKNKDDKEGNYLGSDGIMHNIVEEGHALGWKIRREFLLNTEKIRAAQYNLAGFEPPESMPRWAPLTRQKNGASSVNILQDEPDISAPSKQENSHASSQGGILKDENCEMRCPIQDTTSCPAHQEILMNNSQDVLGNTEDISTNVEDSPKSLESASKSLEIAESFSEAPWCPETLIGLAKARHRPGLFEIGDKSDHAAAEKLLRECDGLSPTQAWMTIDQHICAMMDGPTWYARGRTKKTRFSLEHVIRNWGTVEQELKKEPWSPLDTVPYIGPSLCTDDLPEYGAGLQVKVESPLIIESTLGEPWAEEIIEEAGNSVETHKIEDSLGNPETIEETEEEPVFVSVSQPRGMSMDEYNELFEIVRQEHPEIITGVRMLTDGSFALAIECGRNRWMPVRNITEWRTDPLISRAAREAVRHGQQAIL